MSAIETQQSVLFHSQAFQNAYRVSESRQEQQLYATLSEEITNNCKPEFVITQVQKK